MIQSNWNKEKTNEKFVRELNKMKLWVHLGLSKVHKKKKISRTGWTDFQDLYLFCSFWFVRDITKEKRGKSTGKIESRRIHFMYHRRDFFMTFRCVHYRYGNKK